MTAEGNIFKIGKQNASLYPYLEQVLGSSGGSVGRVVASDTRDPWFESRHWVNLIYQLYNLSVENTKIKKKRPRIVHP